jgi:2-methylcitrate dehydratase PrpD
LIEERMNDPKVHELADRIEIVEDPEATRLSMARFKFMFRGTIDVKMKEDQQYSSTAKQVKWDPFESLAATDAELEDKLRIYADGILSSEKTKKIIKQYPN